MMESTTQPTILEELDSKPLLDETSEVETCEYEFTADLAIELPVNIDPKQFFDYLMRVMIAHTEAYGGSMGGETKWQP
jgi:hypothetical protein